MSIFRGAFVAVVTPHIDGQIDEQGLIDLIEFHIANGTHGIVPCGTTGESATMTHEEHHRVVELTVKTVNGRVPVVAGSGSNSTAEAIDLTRHAKDAGVDGVLMVSPYYNRPSQEQASHQRSSTKRQDTTSCLTNTGHLVVLLQQSRTSLQNSWPNA